MEALTAEVEATASALEEAQGALLAAHEGQIEQSLKAETLQARPTAPRPRARAVSHAPRAGLPRACRARGSPARGGRVGAEARRRAGAQGEVG